MGSRDKNDVFSCSIAVGSACQFAAMPYPNPEDSNKGVMK